MFTGRWCRVWYEGDGTVDVDVTVHLDRILLYYDRLSPEGCFSCVSPNNLSVIYYTPEALSQ